MKIDQVVKLLSISKRPSDFNKENTSISFGLEQLEIKCVNYFSTSLLFKVLSQCHNLTHLVIYNESLCTYDSIYDSFSYPVCDSLKSIKLKIFTLADDIKIALKILQLAPNMEYLEFKYRTNLDGMFIESLSKLCPKLKGIRLKADDVDCIGNYITDDELFKFLQNEPHLEYINIDGCARVNGSIYSKMGQFKQLKYFNVERKCYFDEDIVDQCKEKPFKGDGVLPHLQYLNIGNEMKGVNVDHLLKMAPNVKDIGDTLNNFTCSNLLDIADKLANRLNVIPI